MYSTRLASAQLPLWNMLKKRKIDPLPLFNKVRLDPELMHKPGARYPEQCLNALLNEVQGQIKDQCFGLSIASSWHPSHAGSLGIALLMSSSIRDTLERLLRFHKVLSDGSGLSLEEDQQALSIMLKRKDGLPHIPIREDALLAWLMSLLRLNYQQDLSPVSVDFTHAPPDCVSKFYEYFHAPINFNSESSRLTLPLNVVDQILPSGNEELVAFSEHQIIKYLDSLDDYTLLTRVKKSIVGHLPSGNANIERVASELNMSTRTLQRMLQQKDTSFMSLLNESRMELALQYVKDPQMDLTEVAFLLGFSEQSSFSRSFKRWTGKSPILYRANG